MWIAGRLDRYCLWYIFIIMPLVQTQREPEIVVGPKNVTLFVDAKLSLTCQTTGDQPLTVQWQKRNGTGGRWIQLPRVTDRWRILRRTGELAFSRVLVSDNGAYRCSAENQRGSAYSAGATVRVEAAAMIVKGPKSVTANWGTEVTLDCEVVGFPLPTRSWLKNGKLIVDPMTEMATGVARLRVNVTEDATYTCTAENVHHAGYTNDTKTATVRVIDAQCVPYTGTLCHDVLDRQHVHARASLGDSAVNATEAAIGLRLDELIRTLHATSDGGEMRFAPSCRTALRRMWCRHALPECGSAGIDAPKPLCRETCVDVRDSYCAQLLQLVGDQQLAVNCSSLPSRLGNSPCSLVDLRDRRPADTNNSVNGSAVPWSSTDQSPGDRSTILLFVVVVPLCVVATLVAVGAVVGRLLIRRRRVRRRTSKDRPSTTVVVPSSDSIEIDVAQLPLNVAYVQPSDAADDDATSGGGVLLDPALERLAYDRNGLQYCEDLRTGAFGPVFVAHAPDIGAGVVGLPMLPFVVVKTLRSDASDEARLDFVRIASTLARLVHPNVARLLGVCLDADPLCLIVEYLPGHDLGDFLRSAAPQHFIVRHGAAGSAAAPRVRDADLIGAARQIADAMAFVAAQGFVHRDVAARNCLVGDPTALPLVVKLADFGMAVDLAGREFHCAGDDEEIPVRWMPPESIRENRFTPASDVWSFGVLMWEVFSFGAHPYDQMDARDVIRYVDAGRTLGRPDHASAAVYDVMRKCWQRRPADRPSFATLQKQLLSFEDLARTDIRFT